MEGENQTLKCWLKEESVRLEKNNLLSFVARMHFNSKSSMSCRESLSTAAFLVIWEKFLGHSTKKGGGGRDGILIQLKVAVAPVRT